MSKMKEHLAKLDYFDGVKDGRKAIWEAIKWSNQNPDGSVFIPKERVELIDATYERLG